MQREQQAEAHPLAEARPRHHVAQAQRLAGVLEGPEHLRRVQDGLHQVDLAAFGTWQIVGARHCTFCIAQHCVPERFHVHRAGSPARILDPMHLHSLRHAVVPVLALVALLAGGMPASWPRPRRPPGRSPRSSSGRRARHPQEVGKRVAENYVARPIERWNTGFVIYPEVCTWYGSLTFAALSGNKDLQTRLVTRFDPLLTADGAKRISPEAHVDFRVFGAVPLEIYLANKDPRVLEHRARGWPTSSGRTRRRTASRPRRATGSTTCT